MDGLARPDLTSSAPTSRPLALLVTGAAGASAATIESVVRRGFLVIVAATDTAALEIAGGLILDLLVLHEVEPARARYLVSEIRHAGQPATIESSGGPEV